MAVTDVHRTLHILRSTIRCSTRRPGSSPSFYTASGRGYARIHLAPRGRQSSLVVSAGRSAAMRELEAGREERRAQELEAKRPVVRELTWARPLEIVRYPDPRLRAINATIDCFDENLAVLAREMFDVMYNSPDDGVGLAAPQVGVNVRLMVFNPEGRGKEHEVVLVNPKVISSGGGLGAYEEGCLSFPRVFGDVVRPKKVKVKAQDLQGNKFVLQLTGFSARVFLHEFDHLEGVLFHDRMAPDVLKRVRPELVQLEEAFLAQQPDAQIQRVA